ncbi:hypothetical protein CR513_20510, partial [Mucuna pruriens]
MFLAHKESFKVFFVFCKHIQNEESFNIASIRSDHGKEFENENFQQFCEKHGIHHNFAAQKLLKKRPILKKTHYELWKGKQSISYFHPFGCDCFILNNKDNLGKLDPKSNKGIFIGYLTTSKAYGKVKESIHVEFNYSKLEKELSKLIEPFAELNIKKLQTTSKELFLDN